MCNIELINKICLY